MRTVRFSATLLLMAAIAAASPSAEPNDDLEFFEKKIRPLFATHCLECHGPDTQESGLRVDHVSFLQMGGDTGPVLAAGKPNESRLLEAVRYTNVDLQMPPTGKLPDGAIADIEKWIRLGAPWPEEDATTGKQQSIFDLDSRKREHWCWQPLQATPPPAVKDESWPRSPIDRFLLARLERESLSPADDADRRTLLRRVTFDLIGLPPTREEVDAFLADDSSHAYEKVVDRLLASPHFGERWARHWLDQVRYAETFGHEFDYAVPHAFEYRDYLIRALNADVPYDQFLMEHVAGDLLPHPRLHPDDGHDESIIATGFWFFHEQTHAPVDVLQHQSDRIDNQVDTLGKAFLGLTLGCARCHDHKFDAISAKDVHALWGFLQSSRMQEAILDGHGEILAAVDRARERQSAGDRSLADAIPNPSNEQAEHFSQYLLRARDVLSGKAEPSAQAPADTTDRGAAGPLDTPHLADEALLKVWVEALSLPDVKSVSHPLHAWPGMADGGTPDFAKWRRQAIEHLERQRQAWDEATRDTTLFEDFRQGTYGGWFVSGHAFGSGPTNGRSWDSASSSAALVPLGWASSRHLGDRYAGVLRSRTFAIAGNRIFVRAAGKHARIRVVVDGYVMDTFSSLLFNGMSAKVDQEDMSWIVLGKDLGRYVGHRAHLEFHDDGAGWIAIDEIRFGNNRDSLPEPPNPWTKAVLESLAEETPAALADAYGHAWNNALARWREGSASSEDCRLLDWALRRRLIVADPERFATLAHELEGIEKQLPPFRRVLAIADGNGVDQPVYLRGKHQQPGEIVPRRFLEAIAGKSQSPMPAEGSGRLELAMRMLDDGNPLTTRVAVNRVWYHLFGRGIVETIDNFGVQGKPPSHPELLDWLAVWFRTEGRWSNKNLIRMLVLSRAYRMDSKPASPAAEQTDPENILLHRMNIRRLEGEVIRDSLLAVSGRLDRRMFGPSVPIHLTPFMLGRGQPESGPVDGDGRRSIYIVVRRNFLSPMMLAFDTPIPFQSIGQRSVSNVPAQALILMNDPLVLEMARTWGKRVTATPGQTHEERVETMYAEAFARPPTPQEREAALTFIERQSAIYGENMESGEREERVWADLGHALFNAKEFLFPR